MMESIGMQLAFPSHQVVTVIGMRGIAGRTRPTSSSNTHGEWTHFNFAMCRKWDPAVSENGASDADARLSSYFVIIPIYG